MALNTKIRGKQLNDLLFGAGLSRNVSDENIMEIADLAISNAMLAGSIEFSKMVDLTVDRALVSDGSGDVSISAVTATELGYVSGVTSGIQGQLNALSSGYNRRAAVINIVDNTAVPPTEVSGDRYILDATGVSHANWDGAAANSIVEFNGTTWEAVTPEEGYVAYVDTTNIDALFVDDGTPGWETRSVLDNALNDGQLFVGSAGNIAVGKTITGDVTINNSGVTTIGALKVATGMLQDDSVTADKLDAGVAGLGLSSTDGVLALDYTELSVRTPANQSDYLIFQDSSFLNEPTRCTFQQFLSQIAGGGLQAISNSMRLDFKVSLQPYPGAEAQPGADLLAIYDDSVGFCRKSTVTELVARMAGAGLTATDGVLTVADNIVETDYVKTSETAIAAQTVMTSVSSGNPVVANSVLVSLNGLVQEVGAGNDYTLAEATGVVTFLTALDAGDLVGIQGVLDN